MDQERLRTFSASKDCSIRRVQQTPFQANLSADLPADLKGQLQKAGLHARKQAHENHNTRLANLNIEDQESKNSLFAQAVSAMFNYSKNNPIPLGGSLHLLAFFTEPKGNRFLIGEIAGNYGMDGFELTSILIRDTRDTVEDIEELMATLQYFKYGVPQVVSSSIEAAIKSKK